LPGRSQGDRLWAKNLGIVLTHDGFMCGELLLNRRPFIASGASQVALNIGQLIRIEAKLGFSDSKVVRAGGGRCTPCLRRRRLRQLLNSRLVFFDDLLEVLNFPRESERRSRERVALGSGFT
jgi:hypothetical protein